MPLTISMTSIGFFKIIERGNEKNSFENLFGSVLFSNVLLFSSSLTWENIVGDIKEA